MSDILRLVANALSEYHQVHGEMPDDPWLFILAYLDDDATAIFRSW